MKRWLSAVLLIGSVSSFAAECMQVGEGTVRFEIVQDGSPFQGEFHDFGGTVCRVGNQVERIAVWLEPASVDTGLPELDAALQEPEFFDTARHSRIRFESDSVDLHAGKLLASGALEVKGMSAALEVPFSLEQENGRYRVSGSLVVDRLKFDIGTGEWSDTRWLGRDVTVMFETWLENTTGKDIQN